MAAIRVNIDASGLDRLIKKYPDDETKDKILRTVSLGVINMMTQRIHIRGEKTDGSIIGVYSERYLKVRKSEKYKRTETNIVFSLTSNLEGDWSVIDTKNGYGVGFKTPDVFELVKNLKDRWKKVFELSPEEKEKAIAFIKSEYLKELKS